MKLAATLARHARLLVCAGLIGLLAAAMGIALRHSPKPPPCAQCGSPARWQIDLVQRDYRADVRVDFPSEDLCAPCFEPMRRCLVEGGHP